MHIYLAHPVCDYRTPRQAKAVALIEAAGHTVENPDTAWHQRFYRQRGMEHFVEVVNGCDGVAFMRFRNGTIGAGVAKEIEKALTNGAPIWDVTNGRMELHNTRFMPEPVLSVEDTRAQLKAEARVLAAMSCGDASAIAAKEAIADYGDRVEVYYCDTFAFEHPDNLRFFNEVQAWLGQPITVLKSDKYRDIYDVFERTRWLVGVGGARCTTELKKMVRVEYQRPDDLHVFGFTAEEGGRVAKFHKENPDLMADFILHRKGITKAVCHQRIRQAGIELPAMYRLGYKNNNCIGCVKGQSGYWNKIRVDFPDAFDRMAKMERQLNAAICKKEGVEVVRDATGEPVMTTDANGEPKILTKRWRKRVFLDELPHDAGRYEAEPDIECGVLCIHEPAELNPPDPYPVAAE